MTLIVDRYEFSEDDALGIGGMGMVYLGKDKQTNEKIAIKHLKPEVVAGNMQMIERFRREGEALRQLNHPNIVKMLDAVEQNDNHFLIMEYVSGGDLRTILNDTPQLPLDQILTLAIELADALTRAHYLQIIHRDLKPANVLIADDGTPRLSDFGIAHKAGQKRVTQTGVAVGTLDYLAPELFNGEPPTTRTDIWSAGVMLFEMIAGKRPFKANTMTSMINAIMNEPMPDLEVLRPDCPTALADLTYRMLARNPNERIPSVRLIGAELEAIIQSADTADLTLSTDQKRRISSTASFSSFDFHFSENHNLPGQTTPFIGREEEINQLMGMMYMANIRLVTILAPGGMGKTRLALAVGERYNIEHPLHGVYFIELAPLNSVDDIVPTIAQAVNYQFQRNDISPKQELLEYLQKSRFLLIMDNFEHLISGVNIVTDILQAAPNVQIIATSRERLNLNGENILQLEGMEYPESTNSLAALDCDAVELFVQSAARLQPDFILEIQELEHIVRICQLVYGSPLGILLAAGWLDMFPLKEIAEQINQSLDFLQTDQRDIPEDQRSFRAVFEYSWNLLNDAEKDTLRRISVFRGGMTRHAAQNVAGANLRTLSALVNKSLLKRDAATGRYHIHELLREFAQEALSLSDANSIPEVKDAHTNYFASFMKKHEAHLKGDRQLTARTEIAQDFENIRTAWLWGVQQGNVRAISNMIESLYLYCTFAGLNKEAISLFTQARWQWYDDADPLTGRLLSRFIDDSQNPLEPLERALNIAQQLNDRFEIAFCQQRIGVYKAHILEQFEDGLAMLEVSKEGYIALGAEFYIAQVLDEIGWTYALMGLIAEREVIVGKSLALRRKIGDKSGMANALRSLASSFWLKGEFNKSIAQLKEAHAISTEIGDLINLAWSSSLLGMRYILNGEIVQAKDLIDEGLTVAKSINDGVVISLSQHIVAFYECLKGNIEEAQTYREKAQAFDSPNKPHALFIYFSTFIFSVIDVQQGDIDSAKAHIWEGLETTPFNIPQAKAWLLPAIALIKAHEGQEERAAEIVGVMDKLQVGDLAWRNSWALFNDKHEQLRYDHQEAYERGQNTDLKTLIEQLTAEFK